MPPRTPRSNTTPGEEPPAPITLRATTEADVETKTEMCFDLTLDDVTFRYWPRRVTIAIDATCRTATGAPAAIHESRFLNGQVGIDTIVALAWVARLQAGERVSWPLHAATYPDSSISVEIDIKHVDIEASIPE